MSRPASAGDRSPRSGPLGWRLLSSAAADRSRTGLGVVCPPSFRRGPFRPWTSTGMFLSGQSWPSSRTSIAWRPRQASPLLVAGLLLHRSMGLLSETSPTFHLPPSPLLRSLLDDTNLALPKFLEDQTVHGFLPFPSCRHCR